MKLVAVVVAVLVFSSSAFAHQDEGTATVPQPNYARMRQALQRSATPPVLRLESVTSDATALGRNARQRDASSDRRDSVWNGALIGAAIGGVGGYIWAQDICGGDDSECFAISGPVGILGGAGIGLVVGAVDDALHK